MKEDYVKVPTQLLRDLEDSRKKLYSVLESTGYFKEDKLNKLVYLTSTTQVMWELGNRKWDSVK